MPCSRGPPLSSTGEGGHPRFEIRDFEDQGHSVEVAGILCHVGENHMTFRPCREDAAKWLDSPVPRSRQDLPVPSLKRRVSQRTPTEKGRLNRIDITADPASLATADPAFFHLKAFDLPQQREKQALDTVGMVSLDELAPRSHLEHTSRRS